MATVFFLFFVFIRLLLNKTNCCCCCWWIPQFSSNSPGNTQMLQTLTNWKVTPVTCQCWISKYRLSQTKEKLIPGQWVVGEYLISVQTPLGILRCCRHWQTERSPLSPVSAEFLRTELPRLDEVHPWPAQVSNYVVLETQNLHIKMTRHCHASKSAAAVSFRYGNARPFLLSPENIF